MNRKLSLILCITMHAHIHTAGLLPVPLTQVPLKPHKSFSSDGSVRSDSPSITESDFHHSPPITASDLQRSVVDNFILPPIITPQTVQTPECSPRIELTKTPPKTPPSPPEAEVARVELSIAADKAEFGSLQADRKEQLQRLERLERVKELREYVDKLGPEILVSQALQKARRESEEFIEPSPGGSASMSPASSVTSSYSSALSSASTSPKQSPLFASTGSPQKGSPSPKSSPLHKGAAAPYAAPPPIPGRTTHTPERENLFRKHLQHGTSSRTLVSAALATLSPKSLPTKESGKKSDG